MPNFSYLTGDYGGLQLQGGGAGYLGAGATAAYIVGNLLGEDHRRLGVDGTVLGGIYLIGNGNSVNIGKTGVVAGYPDIVSGILLTSQTAGDATTLFNAGQVSGWIDAGVNTYGAVGGAEFRITNSGSITGQISGIGSAGVETLRVNNSGRIEGGSYGIAAINGNGDLTNPEVFLTNTGTIQGWGKSLRLGDRADYITNSGLLDGKVDLGGGDNVLSNRGGRILGEVYTGGGNDKIDNRGGLIEDRAGYDGYIGLGLGNDTIDNRGGTILAEVMLEGGNDTFRLGIASETVDGGDGTGDVLDARSSPGGVIDLVGDRGTGWSDGDVMRGFEIVLGSTLGADRIIGSSAGNTLFGYGGNDTLDGAGGSDWLCGGRGADLLICGAGKDTLRYVAIDEFGDVVTDFQASGTSEDRFIFTASALGGGLVAGGALAANRFQTRADNLAQDADDRFIFRTTDQTLWFDADGTGAGMALMVADLQAGAVVTTADILFV